MSDKKSLLTESEIRRFMTLANIPVLKEGVYGESGQSPQDPRHPETVRPGDEKRMAEAGEEEMDLGELSDEEPAGEEAAAGEEMPAGDMGGSKEEELKNVFQTLADLVGVDLDFGEEDSAAEPSMGGEEEGEEQGEEEQDQGEEEQDQGEEESEEEELDEAIKEGEEKEELEEQLQESKLVDAVLARVTARLVSEAKKKKEEKKKKMSAAEKMKAMKAAKDKKKKLEEANAPAPKSTTSNASAAGVAKGNGPGSKAFGTDEKKSMKWKEGKGEKGHALQTASASAEHTVSHGKKNLAVQGGNKKG
jgi:hypothetical protein